MLASSGVIKKEKDERKVNELMSSFEERKTNARITKVQSGIILPLFNRYVQYSKLCSLKNISKEQGIVDIEFEARGMLDKLIEIWYSLSYENNY